MFDPQAAFAQQQKAAPSVGGSTGGFDPQVNFEQGGNMGGTISTSNFDPQANFEKTNPTSSKINLEGAFYDAVGTGTKYIVSKALSSKSIPKGIFDDAKLGIGKVQGWCGDYASRISTATKVGDTWAEKVTHIEKRDGIKAGDKVLLPLGVTYDKNGKPQGWGHVVVALTDQDQNGNFAVAQSNADGRQNRGEGPGVATYGVFNTNDLNKRYKENWGAASGQLKVDPFPASVKQQPVAPVAQAKVPQLYDSPTGNVLTDFPVFASNALIDRLKSTQTSQNAVPAGPPAPKKLTNDQAPPNINKSDYTAEALAQYVLKKNITDLTSKKWWVNSPMKDEAWKIIAKATGAPKYGNTTLSQGKVNPNESDFTRAVMGVLDPNGIFTNATGGNLTDNEIAQRGNISKNLNVVGGEMIKRVQDKVYSQPEGTIQNNFITRSLGNSVASVGQGFQDITGGQTGNEKPKYVQGIQNIVFGGAGIVNPGVAEFNAVTQLPGVDQAAQFVFGKVDNFNNWALDLTGQKQGEFRDFLNFSLMTAEFYLAHKTVEGTTSGVKSAVKDFVLNKKVTYSPSEMKAAFAEITSGVKDPAKPVKPGARDAALNLIKDSAEGVKQKEMLKQSFTKGLTVTEARDFAGWFNKFFRNVKPEAVAPEFAGLLTDGKKVASGEMSPVEFTKKARDVMAKGESATLRDVVESSKKEVMANPKATLPDPVTGKIPAETFLQQSAQLKDLQSLGQKTVFEVTHSNNQQALDVQTYTYSDHKTGIGFTINTDDGKILVPISGAYETPRAAMEAITPTIERLVNKGSDIASEAIRSEIDKLKTSKYEAIPAKPEIMPWEDNYTPPPPSIDYKNASKEVIQKEIDQMVTDYVDHALKPTAKQGVTPGGLARDPTTGEVVGRQGRVSNNPEWYRKAFAENNRTPTVKQLREIAADHLLNGVQDAAIGDLPGDPKFKQLVQALATAKPEKVLKLENVKPPNERPVTGSTVSTPESRAQGRNTYIKDGTGKTKTSISKTAEQLIKEGGGSMEFQGTKKIDDMARGITFAEKYPEAARDIALGYEDPPENISRNAIDRAVMEQAKGIGDMELYQKVARAHIESRGRMAQELALDSGLATPDTAEYWIKQALGSLELDFKPNKFLTKAELETIQGVKDFDTNGKSRGVNVEDVKKVEIKKADKVVKEVNKKMRDVKNAQALLESLICK